MMTQQDFVEHLSNTGWSKDPHGRDWYTKDIEVMGHSRMRLEKRHTRVRIQKTSVRIELKSSTGSSFFRIGGCPYSQLTKLPNGDVLALSFRFPRNG